MRVSLGLISRVLGADQTAGSAATANAPKLTVSFLSEADAHLALSSQPSALSDRDIEVPIVANDELLKEVIPGSRCTRYIVFDIAGTDLQYETGDHVAQKFALGFAPLASVPLLIRKHR